MLQDCASEGFWIISSESICFEAFTNLGLDDDHTYFGAGTWSADPVGCFIAPGKTVYFNQATTTHSCDSTYSDFCICSTTKFCSCDNGVGANGTDCPVHGDAKCTRCDVGYRLDNSQCTPNQCSCNNGTGASGTECPTHGDAVDRSFVWKYID